MTITMPLSEAKAKLSEVVRSARESSTETIVTVDGRPAAQIGPVVGAPSAISEADEFVHEALLVAALNGLADLAPFDAVADMRADRR